MLSGILFSIAVVCFIGAITEGNLWAFVFGMSNLLLGLEMLE